MIPPIIIQVPHVDFICLKALRLFSTSFLVSFSASCSINRVELVKAARIKDPKMSTGVGGGNSATRGAKIVASLPPKLQIPDAVPQKRVGNNFTI